MIDRHNYYMLDTKHILQIIMEYIKKGDLLILIYDACILSLFTIGLVRKRHKIVPVIGIVIDSLLKIYAIELKGIHYVRESYNNKVETILLITFLLFILRMANISSSEDDTNIELQVERKRGRIRCKSPSYFIRRNII